MKKVHININEKLSNQFIDHFEMEPQNDELKMDTRFGNGGMQFIEFPSKVDFYHFKSGVFHVPICMRSVNPKDTNSFLFHINLSKVKQEKEVGGQIIQFQKHMPIGVLVYGPGMDIETHFASNVNVEVTSFQVHKDFFKFYFDDSIKIQEGMSYEDLDHEMEECLRMALNHLNDRISCHQYVLEFMKLLIVKLSRRDKSSQKLDIHKEDMQQLFMASSRLRNPIEKKLPTVKELADSAGMSTSKFKLLFKQLFGTSPIQFHHKIRMEYARNELMTKRRTPTELSHEFGYSHPSNFTTAFKKYFGELPSAYY
ncbi:helix-turn-helix transcriptional regulator [Flagellimonas sp. CMM7]|uniref:helix-turn-helix transcriptional regulator n=1 Tax=Flagellimonas sp. CMM7 TaxID=2654676 RepID=UPI0013D6490F|nr:helix-turn-helix transcriptional regulator [Flagellimonas sp. CMM7]UII80445.1 helix-turn-helix transcriptional regulator [Flagellimonas sp. CMM7]